jgi:hypothetical protein
MPAPSRRPPGRPPGRPPVPLAERRRNTVALRLTDAEAAIIEAAAGRAGTDPVDYARRTVLGVAAVAIGAPEPLTIDVTPRPSDRAKYARDSTPGG